MKTHLTLSNGVRYAVVLVAVIVALFPIAWMATMAFKPPAEWTTTKPSPASWDFDLQPTDAKTNGSAINSGQRFTFASQVDHFGRAAAERGPDESPRQSP